MKKKKNLNSIIRTYRIKNLLFSLAHLLVVLIVAFISDKLIEFLTFMLAYSFIRNEFTKAVHGSDFTTSAHKGIVYCRIITTIVQLVSIAILVKVDISKYINIENIFVWFIVFLLYFIFNLLITLFEFKILGATNFINRVNVFLKTKKSG